MPADRHLCPPGISGPEGPAGRFFEKATCVQARSAGPATARPAFKIALLSCLLAALLSAPGCTESEPATTGRAVYNPDWSIARNFNEVLLSAIRTDLARPTVHARNLFHTSVLMYDLWTLYHAEADSYLLGRTDTVEQCLFSDDDRAALVQSEPESELQTAISHGMARMLKARFRKSPGYFQLKIKVDQLLTDISLDPGFTGTDYRANSNQMAALGNYAADCVLAWGLTDNSNEINNYANRQYQPVNQALEPDQSGTPGMTEPDRWQPLKLVQFIDQAGNEISGEPEFVGAEWAGVTPFALSAADKTLVQRDGTDYMVYHDPGPPAWLRGPSARPAEYMWNHSMVAYWSSHLDPGDGVMWDISPAAIGRTSTLPAGLDELHTFYNEDTGRVQQSGHSNNPATGQPYAEQLVPRGDYTRVLAEFWADGPDSETPPGHWFVILNELVSSHPLMKERKYYKGDSSQLLSDLEWDIKAYFVLGGAMHDSAVAAWSIKGAYDYVRPLSALRYMASLGQSSDTGSPSYNAEGIPLKPGLVELVKAGDALAGPGGENIGKIRVKAWRGHTWLADTGARKAGVGWILLEDWWPYQRPTFVSPPFAGYISGHSTFSRAAAEVLTAFTGSEFFPGGLGSYTARRNEFLQFEEGPSVDVILQWATYRDASDQTSLSRIWGGIHPPVDDIPGRKIGIKVGQSAFAAAEKYFNGTAR